MFNGLLTTLLRAGRPSTFKIDARASRSSSHRRRRSNVVKTIGKSQFLGARMRPRSAKIGQDWPKRGPRSAQDGSQVGTRRAKIDQDRPKIAEDIPRWLRSSPKHLRSSIFSTVLQVRPFLPCSPRYVEQPLSLLPGFMPSRFVGFRVELSQILLEKMVFAWGISAFSCVRRSSHDFASSGAPIRVQDRCKSAKIVLTSSKTLNCCKNHRKITVLGREDAPR